MKNGAAGGSEVVRVQTASAGDVVSRTAGENISPVLGFYSRQTGVYLDHHNHTGSSEVEHLGLRVSSVREEYHHNLVFFVFSYSGCFRIELVDAESWKLVHRDRANLHGGDRSADYTDLKE